jgi:glycosyltransferase involved in cell wall biosynthesis
LRIPNKGYRLILFEATTVTQLKILIAHNAYQQRGGEDSVVDAEIALLRSRGHDVQLYARSNDDIVTMPKASAALQTLWSQQTSHELAALIQSFQPDVIHVHNTFPLISPSLYWAASRAGVPVVQTLHNFRLLCPQAMFLRDGKVCEDCLGKLPWRGAVRGCYRGSKAQSTVLAGMVTVHRAIGTWQNKVTRYIALNEFCRNKFIEGGLPADRIAVKPNFVDFDAPAANARAGFLFVGRLSAEKGVDVLVNAARAMGNAQVRVAGTGPDAGLLASVPGVQALGALGGDAVRAEMSQAVALVLPSIWYETFGLVAVEAFAAGTPVIASRIGVLPNLVRDGITGLLFEPGNAQDLADKLRWAQAHPEDMAAMGRNARALYESEFTAERNYAQLITIYNDAIAAGSAS